MQLDEQVLPCEQVDVGEPCGCPNGSTLDLLLGTEDLASVSFGHDTVWETVASLAVLSHPDRHALHRPLLGGLHRRTWDHDLLMSLLAFGRPGRPVGRGRPRPAWPVFLSPTRPSDAVDPRSALASIVEADPAVVARDLEALRASDPTDPRWQSYTPERLVEETAAALVAYWGVVLAPRCERICEIAAADVAHRARVLGSEGLAATLPDLHDRLSYASGRLRLRRPGSHQHRRVGGAGVRFVASVFVWPQLVAESEATPAVVCYPAIGAGRVWERQTDVPLRGLTGVLGRSRGEILRELDVPTTTTRLSRRLQLSPATVSQHLTSLAKAGLLSCSRRGREVFYERTDLGHSLVGSTDQRGGG